ncbi:MFS transporter [Salinarimonas sp.]|uniref:MFS transporter n=1 Tax=Salinarimonas sp. TaxID=2766526 RepID=UPI00391CB4B4
MSLPLSVRLAALSATAFAGIGIAMPYLPVWLESRGVAASLIGLFVALPTLARIVAAPPLLGLTDRGVSARRLIVCAQLGVAAAYAALVAAPDPLVIALVVIAAAIAQAPIVPASELVTTDAVREHRGIDYGRIRIFGSLAFLATTILMGWLLEALPPDAIPIGVAALALVGALVGLGAPATSSERDTGVGATARTPRLPRPLVLAIAAAAMVQASHAGVYAYGTLHWKGLGFPGLAVGWLWAVGVIAEILLFVLVGRQVGKVGGFGLIVIGGLAAFLRFGGLALDPGLGATFLLQALHGLSFGATHLGAMAAIVALAPPGTRGRAQGALAGASALAMSLAMVACGPLYAAGGSLAFLAVAPLGLMGAAIAWRASAGRRLTQS